MSRFAQKSSDNMKKMTFASISEINRTKKLSFRKVTEFCFLFKTCNSSLKTFKLSWINLSSQSQRNWTWQHNWCSLASVTWKILNRCCFSLKKAVCFFSIFSWIFKSCATFIASKLKENEHNFFKQTHSLYLLNLSEITQNFFCLAQQSQKNSIWTFFTKMNWVREKWSKQHLDMMKFLKQET